MSSKRQLLFVAVVGLAAIAALITQIQAGPDSNTPEPISDTLCLEKMSLDLTHRSATAQEITRVKSGESLETLANEYLDSDEFRQVVFDWYRQEFPPSEFTPEGVDVEEPARIAQYVVLQDLDYRQILTGDFTVSPEGVATQVTDRPAAGIMSTQHYMSAYVGSYRRVWAGHFLTQWGGIELDSIALPPEDENRDLSPESLLDDPTCAGCHGSPIYGIDHLAAFAQCYDETGTFIAGCSNAAGSFLTQAGNGLQDLASITSESNEFKAQTIHFFARKMFGRGIAKEETNYYLRAVAAFTGGDQYSARSLLRFFATSPEYCAR